MHATDLLSLTPWNSRTDEVGTSAAYRGYDSGVSHPRRARPAVLLVLTLALPGCPAAPTPTPAMALEPEIVGRVVDVEDPAPGVDVYVLDVGGSRVEVSDDALELHGHPLLDGLLLVGSINGLQWYVALPGSPSDDGTECFWLSSGSAINAGDAILFPLDETYGVRLEKGPQWQEPGYDLDGDRYPIWLNGWCIGADGNVLSVDEGAAG